MKEEQFILLTRAMELRVDREVPSSPPIIYPSATGSFKNGIISLACRAHGRWWMNLQAGREQYLIMIIFSTANLQSPNHCVPYDRQWYMTWTVKQMTHTCKECAHTLCSFSGHNVFYSYFPALHPSLLIFGGLVISILCCLCFSALVKNTVYYSFYIAIIINVRFGVLTAALIKIQVFWYVTLCRLVNY